MANQSPILETMNPEPEPEPIRPSRAETTMLVTGPFSRPKGRLGIYLGCMLGLAAVGVGLGTYLTREAERRETASAAAAAPAPAPETATEVAPAIAPATATATEVAPATATAPETATATAAPATATAPETAPLPNPAVAATATEPDRAKPITGVFVSNPTGATVTLHTDGKAGAALRAPAQMQLDPDKSYAVTFEKDGYATVTKPVAIAGDEVKVVATLERNAPAAKPASKKKARRASRRARRSRARRAKRVAVASSGAKGTLMVGAKPPCRIYVDGRFRGLSPQRSIQLSEGRHRLVLVNREHGIQVSGSVSVKGGRTTRVIRDLRSRMKR